MWHVLAENDYVVEGRESPWRLLAATANITRKNFSTQKDGSEQTRGLLTTICERFASIESEIASELTDSIILPSLQVGTQQ